MSTPATNFQDPKQSILDAYNQQTYLGNQFIYSTGSVSISGTSETPLVLISNPTVSGSSFPSKYKSLFLNFRKVTCFTSSQSAIFRFYFNPTVTGAGTTETPLNLRPANPNLSVATVGLNPTVSANGTYIAALASLAFVSDISTVLAILDPGKSLLITVQCSASASVNAESGWYEI